MSQVILELMVEDVAASIAFYRDILEFVLVANEPDAAGKPYWALMRLGEFALAFKEAARLKSEVPFLEGREVGGSIAIVIEVDDLRARYARVAERFGLLDHPHLTPCGTTQFSLLDNSGYIVTYEQPG
ncbi:MAG: VOC family protein [Bacteroidota bacterium]